MIFIGCHNNFEDFYSILIGYFIKLSVQTFQPRIVIYKTAFDNSFDIGKIPS